MKPRRNEGGYALVYVVVVMTLILALAGGASLISVRQLQSQKEAFERTAERYEAAGEIEGVMAAIKGLAKEERQKQTGKGEFPTETGEVNSRKENYLKECVNNCVQQIKEIIHNSGGTILQEIKETDGAFEIHVTSNRENVTVDVDICVKYNFEYKNNAEVITDPDNPTEQDGNESETTPVPQTTPDENGNPVPGETNPEESGGEDVDNNNDNSDNSEGSGGTNEGEEEVITETYKFTVTSVEYINYTVTYDDGAVEGNT